MNLTIVNKAHTQTKYYIVDSSQEFNVPYIPSDYNLIFQERYSKKLSIIQKSQLNKVFKTNNISYQVLFFNNVFKLNLEKADQFNKKFVKQQFDDVLKLTSEFEFKSKIFINPFLVDQNLHTKTEINNFVNSINQNIEKVQTILNNVPNFANKLENQNKMQSLMEEIRIVKHQITSH